MVNRIIEVNPSIQFIFVGARGYAIMRSRARDLLAIESRAIWIKKHLTAKIRGVWVFVMSSHDRGPSFGNAVWCVGPDMCVKISVPGLEEYPTFVERLEDKLTR